MYRNYIVIIAFKAEEKLIFRKYVDKFNQIIELLIISKILDIR